MILLNYFSKIVGFLDHLQSLKNPLMKVSTENDFDIEVNSAKITECNKKVHRLG